MKKYLFTQKTVFLCLLLAGQQLMGASSSYNASSSASSYSASTSSVPMDDVVLDISFDDLTMDTDAGDTDDVAALTAELARVAIGQTVDRRTKSQSTSITVNKSDDYSKKADDSRSRSQPVLRPSQQQIAAEETKRAAAQYAKENPKEAKASNTTQSMVVATTTDATLSQAKQILEFDEKTPELKAFTPTFYAPFTPHDSCEFPTVESDLLADNLSGAGFQYLFYIKTIQATTLDELKHIITDELPATVYDVNVGKECPVRRLEYVESMRNQLLARTTMPTIKELYDVILEKYIHKLAAIILYEKHINKGNSNYDTEAATTINAVTKNFKENTSSPTLTRLGLYCALKCQIFQHKEMQQILEHTGNSILRYRSADAFFGCGSNNKGANELGQSLMRIREEIRHNNWYPIQIASMQ